MLGTYLSDGSSIFFYSQNISLNSATSDYGIISKGNILLSNTKILGKIISEMGGLTAGDSDLQDINVRDNCLLNNCKVKQLTIRMGGLNSLETIYKTIEARDNVLLTSCKFSKLKVGMAGCSICNSVADSIEANGASELGNCSVKNLLKISTGNLKWINDPQYKNELICNRVEGCDNIILSHIFARLAKSLMGSVFAINSQIEVIEACKSAELTNTIGKKVEVLMGPLKVIFGEVGRISYEILKARDDIELYRICAENVHSSRGTVRAENCVFDSIEAVQKVDLRNSTIKKSLKINLLSQKSTLFLKNSKICKDIVINGNFCINSSQNISKKGFKRVLEESNENSDSKLTFAENKNFRSITEIPENIVLMVLNEAKEGQSIYIGNLKCVVQDGYLKLAPKKLISSQKLKISIANQIGFNSSCSNLEFDGGIFDIAPGVVKTIKSSPNLKIESKKEIMPYVTVELIGGEVGGKVIFENCQGEVKLLEGAFIRDSTFSS